MKTFYLAAAVVGTVIPWLFFADFVAANGVDIPLFVQSLFSNGASGGFTADVLITCCIFWVWSWGDAKEHGVKSWWLTIPAVWFVGISLGLPMYLWLRERAREVHAR